MSYREIPEDRILKFPSTAGFKGWKDFFTKESVAHPAKMNLKLLRHILEVYTSPGDVVLDPMAGTGSTIVLAAMMGRNGIAVEYEPQFCDMIRENIKRVERQTTLTPKGRMMCAHGDARELSKLLSDSDAIITSPPYASPGGAILDRAFMEKLALDPTSNRYGRKTFPGYGKYSERPEQIGNKPYGDIEAIITSPPYGSDNANLLEREDKSAKSILSTTGVKAVPLEEDNIGVLEYGDVDVVITSPPYEATCLDGRDVERRIERLKEAGHDPKDFIGGQARDVELKNYDKVDVVVTSPPYGNRLSDDVVQDGNGARMSYRQAVDSIVTSPPYEDSLKHRGQDYEEVRKKLIAQGYSEEYIKASWSQPHQCQHWAEEAYSKDSENIGNLKSESYLEAMLQCYREYYKVLREGGVMVLVTKNFIRNKAIVRLDLDTISLAESAGFTLKDRWYFKLPTKSFWRILYSKKYPDVPEIDYEDVLVFTKEAEK